MTYRLANIHTAPGKPTREECVERMTGCDAEFAHRCFEQREAKLRGKPEAQRPRYVRLWVIDDTSHTLLAEADFHAREMTPGGGPRHERLPYADRVA